MNKLPKEIDRKTEELIKLCEKFKVKKLFVFGSVLRDDFNIKSSDIDFIVEIDKIPPVEKGENLMKLWTELELLYSKKIDLITNMNLKNPYLKKEIEKSRILIYDRAS